MSLALLILCLPSGAALASGVAFEADVPLVESNGMPCVEAVIAGGHKALFALDSGDADSTIDLGDARSAGLELKAAGPANPNIFTSTAPRVQIGALMLGNVPTLAFGFAANKMPPGIAGTLAYTVFKDRVLQIDYKAHRVPISAPLHDPLAASPRAEHITYLTFGKQGPPIVVVNGFTVKGKAVSVQIDTMYTGAMLIYGASIAKLDLVREARTDETEFFPFTDGGVTMKVSPANTESFHGTVLGPEPGKIFFPTPGVHEPDGMFDGTVGLALLRNSILTFDLHDDTFSVSS